MINSFPFYMFNFKSVSILLLKDYLKDYLCYDCLYFKFDLIAYLNVEIYSLPYILQFTFSDILKIFKC